MNLRKRAGVFGRLPCLFVIAAIIALLTAQTIFVNQRVYVESGGVILTSFPADAGEKFSIRFIHSVQLTPVEEFFEVNGDNGFTLVSTRYESFGVGLPFLESDGKFKIEGNFFVMDDMNRKIPVINFRPGIKTMHAIIYNDQTIPVHEKVAVGSLVKIFIATRYDIIKNFLKGFEY